MNCLDLVRQRGVNGAVCRNIRGVIFGILRVLDITRNYFSY